MKIRNSNIEILRIISIIMIVISHYSVHNGINNYELPIGVSRFILEALTIGNIGSIIFVLISGYFLINSKNLNVRKVIKLYFQIFFYSVTIYFVLILCGVESIKISVLIKVFLPISFEEYWFASAYFILYIFHPFLNKFLNSLSRKEYISFIMICIIIFSIAHTITTKSYFGNEAIQFIIFYSIGAYFSKYKDNVFNSNKINFWLLFINVFIILLSIITLDFIGTRFNVVSRVSTYFMSRTSIFVIIISVCLFNIFINKKETNNSFINKISSCSFGVYLISDNFLLRKYIWIDILKNYLHIKYLLLPIHMIASVLIVFCLCILIEYIRQSLEKKFFEKTIVKTEKMLVHTVNKMEKKFFTIIKNVKNN